MGASRLTLLLPPSVDLISIDYYVLDRWEAYGLIYPAWFPCRVRQCPLCEEDSVNSNNDTIEKIGRRDVEKRKCAAERTW